MTPSPQTLVSDAEYIERLTERIDQRRFPDPDLIPELTRARFVAEAAREVRKSHLPSESKTSVTSSFGRQLTRIEATVAGARAIATEAYEEKMLEADRVLITAP